SQPGFRSRCHRCRRTTADWRISSSRKSFRIWRPKASAKRASGASIFAKRVRQARIWLKNSRFLSGNIFLFLREIGEIFWREQSFFQYLGGGKAELKNRALGIGDGLILNDHSDLIAMRDDGDFIVIDIDLIVKGKLRSGDEIDLAKFFRSVFLKT